VIDPAITTSLAPEPSPAEKRLFSLAGAGGDVD
jgi:hypothetical protein